MDTSINWGILILACIVKTLKLFLLWVKYTTSSRALLQTMDVDWMVVNDSRSPHQIAST